MANSEIDFKQLQLNMKRYNIFPQQILRLIAQSKFMPRDILIALASKSPQTIMKLLSQGTSVTTFMLQKGFRKLATQDDPIVIINLKNLKHPDQIEYKKERMFSSHVKLCRKTN